MTFRYEIESSKAFLFDISKEEFIETDLPKLVLLSVTPFIEACDCSKSLNCKDCLK